jgi:hypothetical protein
MSHHSKAIFSDQHSDEKRLQRQQTISAQQALCGVRAQHDVAQGVGEKLGIGAVLLRCLSG